MQEHPSFLFLFFLPLTRPAGQCVMLNMGWVQRINSHLMKNDHELG